MSTSRTADLGSIIAFTADLFPGHRTSDLKIGTPVATLPGTCVTSDAHVVSLSCDLVCWRWFAGSDKTVRNVELYVALSCNATVTI